MIYESLTGKHIKYYNAGQVSHHSSILDGNHNMNTFPLFTKYAWIGPAFHYVKEIHNHGQSITEVDWGAQGSFGKNLYNVGKTGEHPCGEIFHGNNTKRHIKPHHKWKPLHHTWKLDDNQNMDTPQAFSNYEKATFNHGLSLSEVDWGDPKGE